MAQDWGQELKCPEFLFQGAAEMSEPRPHESRWEVPEVCRGSLHCHRGAGGDTGDRAQMQAGNEVPPCHCCPTHQAASSGRIFVPPQTENTRALDSAPSFKIQE